MVGDQVDPKVKKAVRNEKLRAIAIPIRKSIIDPSAEEVDDAGKGGIGSKQDPLGELRGAGRLIEPPFDLSVLAALAENNSVLGQVVEAMETNVVGFGWSLEAVRHSTAVGEDGTETEEGEVEWENLHAFLEYGNWGEVAESLTACRRHLRRDYELTGMSYLEIIENGLGRPVGYVHAPSHRMRLTVTDAEFTPFYQTVMVGRGKRRKPVQVLKRKQFRRYVQIDPIRNKLVWFKEFGDPRPISRHTGEVLEGPDAKNTTMRANPMIYRRIYAPRTPYGIPRYIGTLLAILGGRCAEEVNYATFRNNQIPSMLVLVSGGALTDATIDRISEFSENVIQGDDNRSKFLIIEAEPDPAVDNTNPGSTGGSQNVRIEAKPLREAIHEDAMFIEYEKGNAEKIRQCWRLPPITIGSASDYSRAVADTSRRLAEEQIFEPERSEEDTVFNRLLWSMGMQHHEFKTNSPNVTNDEDLIQIIATAERSGAMTPRLCSKLLEGMLGFPIPTADETEVPPDVPYSLTMAETVKNLANTSEPGQRVTAVKSMDPVETLFAEVERRYGLKRVDFREKTAGELIEHIREAR